MDSSIDCGVFVIVLVLASNILVNYLTIICLYGNIVAKQTNEFVNCMLHFATTDFRLRPSILYCFVSLSLCFVDNVKYDEVLIDMAGQICHGNYAKS